MSSYLVKTPNPEYTGKVHGIQFSDGRAVISKETLNPQLGYSLEQVILSFRKDFGYEVIPLGIEPAPQVVELATTEESPKPKSKRVTRRKKGAEVTEPAFSQ